MKQPKVALVHDYLVQYGGAEKTLEAISELFPIAPIYTGIYKPKNLPESIRSKEIITQKSVNSVFNLIPIFSKYFTFLIPLVFEGFDLREYDIVISDSSSYAKGVLTKPNQLHVSFIHTPPRFIYSYSVENTKRTAWYYYPVVMLVDHFLRLWDSQAAQRPDYLVANSQEIRKRIKKFYHRESLVIYPPVELADTKLPFANDVQKDGGYYLTAGRLVAYKNFDVVIKAFNQLPQLKLLVIGIGNEEKRLKNMAGENITFLGRVSDEEKHKLMHHCLGLINAVKDEDFGIVPIEVLSHGRPVLAQASAGHLETIQDGVTGMYFEEVEDKSLADKISVFDKAIREGKYDSRTIQNSVQKFSKETFKKTFHGFVLDKWQEHEAKSK